MPFKTLISTTTATAQDMFLDILFHQYPTFLVKYSTTWTEVTDGSSQCITYACKLSNSSIDWGLCKI